jgi:hypothetical protein
MICLRVIFNTKVKQYYEKMFLNNISNFLQFICQVAIQSILIYLICNSFIKSMIRAQRSHPWLRP